MPDSLRILYLKICPDRGDADAAISVKVWLFRELATALILDRLA